MHYPIFLDLAERPVVVVGGGRVAMRKTRSLLAAGARVAVISPAATAMVRRWAKGGRVRWVRRRYRAGDLRGARLAVAATDDETVNRQVCSEARRRKIFVNCAAPPGAGDFLVPSVMRRGPLAVAISTGGASPALARQMRRDLEQFMGRRYARAAQKMRRIRRTATGDVPLARDRRELYRRILRKLLVER